MSIKENPDSFDETKSSLIDIIRAYTFFDETDPSNEWSPLNWTESEKKILGDHADKIPSVMRQVFATNYFLIKSFAMVFIFDMVNLKSLL